MTKLDELTSFLHERLTVAVNEILDTVNRTMQEYEEETARIRTENNYLKELLKNTGRSSTQSNADEVAAVYPENHDCILSLEQQPKPQESLSQPQAPKKENDSIKTEPFSPPCPADPEIEPEKTRNTVVPSQCTPLLNTHSVDQEVIDYNFTAKVKVESMTKEPHSGDASDNVDISNQCWSPPNLDLLSENSYQSRVQQGSGQQSWSTESVCTTDYAFQNQTAEFQAAFSYAQRTICSNRHCTSKHCELQKRTTSKSSPVWQYFSLKAGDCSKAVCLMCKAVISRGVKEYTTSALLKHLRMKHGKC
ncbi:uncharacterized protein si:dkey-93n13.2 [Trichomycterus rosablanca]|uniref:uncharacterized protein si:dkey-93n13.2 n=1 Tax=Trichomycterus rosablanca TaxID=2290929 RepID=UPI002F3604B4